MPEIDSLYIESTDPLAYRKFHQAIRRERGDAARHRCAAPGCAEQARNWAWTKRGPWSSGLNAGTPVTWGLDVMAYEPMCARDATRMDRGGTLTHCPSEHPRSPENTYRYPSGAEECRECRREKRKARRALRVRKPCATCGAEILEHNLARHMTVMHGNEGQVKR